VRSTRSARISPSRTSATEQAEVAVSSARMRRGQPATIREMSL
jgi:hypothetical protein